MSGCFLWVILKDHLERVDQPLDPLRLPNDPTTHVVGACQPLVIGLCAGENDGAARNVWTMFTNSVERFESVAILHLQVEHKEVEASVAVRDSHRLLHTSRLDHLEMPSQRSSDRTT